MDAVKSFLHKSDKAGSTEVCTENAAPVTQEQVTHHQKVETAEAVDRERHEHHHQHRIQPVRDSETLPAQHRTEIAPEVQRETRADVNPAHESKLHQQHNAVKSSRTEGPTEVTQEQAGSTVNEHVHHHVHEHVTPVIQKETHAHTNVHNVIPVHEKVHDAPIVHETTVLPTLSKSEFDNKIGEEHHHGESSHKHAFYEGQPKVDERSAESQRAL